MQLALPTLEGQPPVSVQVWGPAALFTRPEAKVERLTYPVMTPSAAIGVLESIFWKPEFRWRIVAIEVLKPIREATIRRNETTQVVTQASALKGQTVDTAEYRTQRAATYLTDVAYRIHGHVELLSHATDPAAKYRDQFRRRVDRGACFTQPYLGTKEFSAWFGPVDTTPPVPVSEDLGVMLHSIHHGRDGANPRSEWFTARLDQGVMHVPAHGIPIPGVDS